MTTLSALPVTVRDVLFGAAWGPLARGTWCRTQRRLLRVGPLLVAVVVLLAFTGGLLLALAGDELLALRRRSRRR